MKYVNIKGTDLMACPVVLGSAEFGTSLSMDDSFALLDAYAQMGGNIIDTASFYADWLKMGKSISEKTIGMWFKERKNRDKFIISTKGGHHDIETGQKRLDYDSMKSDLDRSFKNLKTDYIDMYWFHKDDESKSPEELIETLNKVTEGGRVGYLGASNWKYDRIKAANDHAIKNGLKPFVAGQMRHSIAKINYKTAGILSLDETDYNKYCEDNLNVFGFSTQARGFFAIMDKKGEQGLSDFVRNELFNEHNVAIFEKLKILAKEKNTSVAALVLAVLIADKKVTTFAQVGSRTAEELALSMAALDVKISEEERHFVLG